MCILIDLYNLYIDYLYRDYYMDRSVYRPLKAHA